MSKIKIQELSVEGCARCAAAKKILEEEIKPDFPEVETEYIDLLSNKGQEMAAEYGIMSSPAIILNDEIFSVGSLDKDKLVKKIQDL